VSLPGLALLALCLGGGGAPLFAKLLGLPAIFFSPHSYSFLLFIVYSVLLILGLFNDI
jgi:hypothetical protein